MTFYSSSSFYPLPFLFLTLSGSLISVSLFSFFKAALCASDPLYQIKRQIVQKNSLLTKNVFQVRPPPKHSHGLGRLGDGGWGMGERCLRICFLIQKNPKATHTILAMRISLWRFFSPLKKKMKKKNQSTADVVMECRDPLILPTRILLFCSKAHHHSYHSLAQNEHSPLRINHP